MTDWELHEGDARDILPTLAAGSVGAVVTDPPYGLVEPRSVVGLNRAYRDGRTADEKAARRGGFMGQKWDGTGIAFNVDLWEEVYRVMKPGAYLLAFGGTRTYHRMACAIEDAGFLIKDSLMWCHGQGFPKSKNLGDGLGTALKPSFEPIVLAQKPLDGTYAANVARHGVGGLDIDGCRVGLPEDKRAAGTKRYTPSQMAGKEPGDPEGYLQDAPHDGLGRWPTNLVLTHSPLCVPTGTRRVKGTNAPTRRGGQRQSGFAMGPDAINHYADADGLETVAAWSCVENCPVAILDAQAGERKSGKAGQDGHRRTGPSGSIYGAGKGLWRGAGPAGDLYGDTGGASRYYPQFHWDTAVDFPNFSPYNKGESEGLPCDEIANTAVEDSTRNHTTCGAASGGSVPESAGAHLAASPGVSSHGGISASPTGAGIASGARPEAGNSISNSNTAGSGNSPTAPSPTAAKSIIATSTPPTTTSEISNSSPSQRTTTCTDGSARTTASLAGLSNDAANGAPNTNRSTSSPSAAPEPTTGIANLASSPLSANGSTPIATSSTPSAEQSAAPDITGSPAPRLPVESLTFPAYYAPKASRSERGKGNDHPTVKNLALVSWLVRLICPPGETCLDPFAGSGTTGVACILEGRAFIGIERELEYIAIARRRLETTQPALPGLGAAAGGRHGGAGR